MKNITLTIFLLCTYCTLKSQNFNYLLEYSGSGSASNIVGNTVATFKKMGTGTFLKLSYNYFPIVQSESQFTNSQTISNYQIVSNSTFSNYEVCSNGFGSDFAMFDILGPLPNEITITQKFNASTNVNFNVGCLSDLLPLSIPSDIQVYLTSSTNIQSNNPSIRSKALEIINGTNSVYKAVEEIAKWIQGNVEYYSAYKFNQDASSVFSFRTVNDKGVIKSGYLANCEGYANLTIAMLRSIGIPARYVSGFTLQKQYYFPYVSGPGYPHGGGLAGPHANHEIYYPSSGWVRGDAQSTVHFGSTNFIKEGHAHDSRELIMSSYSYTTTGDVTIDDVVSYKSTVGSVTPNFKYLDQQTFPTNRIKTGIGLLSAVVYPSTKNTESCFVPGVWDKVVLTNATDVFAPGQSVSYSANFTSGWGDTWPINWNWRMVLFHEDGYYVLGNQVSPSSYWSFTTNSSLPDYRWLRDINGNILGEVSVAVDINDGDSKSDKRTISVQYKPNKPVVNIASYINDNDPLNNSFTFSIDSKSSDSYKVYYSSSNTAHQGVSPISITNGDVVTLSNLNYHDKFWVTGVNSNGESISSNIITVGKYLGLPLTYTSSSDQKLCVTKYESSNNGSIKKIV